MYPHFLTGLHFSRFAVFAACVIFAFSLSSVRAAEVLKSPNDNRSYEFLELENGLKVLLISDPETDKAAAALDVNVGNGSDPKSREGLAHFLEHMLFLGTEKYPEPGEYKNFISEHGGVQNAYTTFDHTNYYFNVDKEFFEPALDRFAQFFIAPLFNERYVTRERQVVHSEYVSGMKSDGRRIFSASKQAINPEHPYANFPVGSLETLADRPSAPVRDDLIAFYRSHYSAGLMALVVLGKEPLEVLLDWVRSRFSRIPNTGAEPLRITTPLYAPGQLPARLDVVPIKEQRSLSLSFPVPPVIPHYRSKPISHIAHLLGHEGKGSLLSLLRSAGWADGLSAGTGFDHSSEATFTVSIKLTRQGLEHVDDIAGYVFQYLKLIGQQGLERWIFEENRRLAEIQFRFQEMPSPLSYVRGLAAALHIYPARDVLIGPYVYEDFDPGLIAGFLDRLTPDNLLMTVVANDVETDSLTPRYKTPFRLRPLDPATAERWRVPETAVALAIPEPNVFIPDDLVIKPVRIETAVPVKLDAQEGIELWHKQDQTFTTPRADFYVSVRSPVANDSPLHDVYARLYVAMVNDQLNEFSYPAGLAGLNYSLYRHIRGLTIRISGYSAKQGVLLERIVAALASPQLDGQRFRILKSDLIRTVRNRRQNRPYERALDDLRDMLIDPQWDESEQLAAIERTTMEGLRGYIGEFSRRLQVVVLAHGNLAPEDARELQRIIQAGLLAKSRAATVPRGRLVKLKRGDRFLREIGTDHEESAAVIYLQGEDRELKSRAAAALVSQIVSPAFFEQLRTEKQLGYIVFASPMTLFEVPGIALVVQSPVASPAALAEYMGAFLRKFHATMQNMESGEYSRHQAALVGNILEEETRLQERTNRYWDELDREHYEFDLRERLAAAVKSVTREQLESFYRQYLLNESRRQITLYAFGEMKNESAPGRPALGSGDAILVESVAAFKKERSFFPP
jgi:secreted Zn-dependent insulinase-like peptidase